ncbi:MAG: hypothetical protein QOI76_1482 [Frankiales bacterium]|nr:hypothetical protein [Frankiales bacterium]
MVKSVAQKAGYGLLKDAAGISCIADPAGDALVYQPVKGGMRLVAAEYVVFAAGWDAKHTAPPRLFGQTFELAPLWKHNPSGTFHDWNPTVTCP